MTTMERPSFRRGFLGRAAALAAAARAGMLATLLSPALPAWAQKLVITPAQSKGPFYPTVLPPDQDADLMRIGMAPQLSQGEMTHLSGRVFDAAGRVAGGVRVEIWQCDANGRYHHPGDRRAVPLDPDFQGFGAMVTDASGNYAFRTIKPVPYPGRTPHIHFRLVAKAAPEFVTQMYIAGQPGNDADGLLMSVRDPRERGALLVPFRAIKGEGGRTEWTAAFDIVLPFRVQA
jgi:protocatechuate 3,4-dioxygenase, beta subunit